MRSRTDTVPSKIQDGQTTLRVDVTAANMHETYEESLKRALESIDARFRKQLREQRDHEIDSFRVTAIRYFDGFQRHGASEGLYLKRLLQLADKRPDDAIYQATLYDVMQGQVLALKKMLTALGYYSGIVTSRKDERYIEAVKGFQNAHRPLKVDGKIGKETLSRLMKEIEMAGLFDKFEGIY